MGFAHHYSSVLFMSQQVSQNPITKHQLCTEWVALYSDELYSWACYKINDSEASKDLVQDTFLAAFKGLDSFKDDSNPKTWLFSILNNKVIDHYRAKGKSIIECRDTNTDPVVAATNALFDGSGNWDSRPVNNWQAEAETNLLDDHKFNATMTTCLNDLPENWRAAVVAKYLLAKDGGEVCTELGISKANYWQILHRAKLLLKECLEIHWFNKQR